jgi:glycosyltransferase involved in cell wall biosynthesis
MKKIAIVRGSNLNKWEMQNYEPLMDRFDITAYSTARPHYDISQIKMPVLQMPPHPEHPDTYMPGLEDHLADKDIVFTADITWLYSSQAIVAKEKYGCRVICLEWENIPFVYEDIAVVRRIKEIVRSRADYFIAVTNRAKEALILEGVSDELIDVIPMGIDLEKFRPDCLAAKEYRNKLEFKEDELVVLYVGRMVWEKGIYDFIHSAASIFKDINTANLPVRFLMVGSGPEMSNVRNRVDSMGLSEGISFLDSASYDEMPHLHNLADIFVLPSIPMRTWQEQFGMVMIEAMACGKPVIASLTGSIPEVISDCGILVQPNDPLSLSGAIKELMRDRGLRESLGRAAMNRVKREYDANSIAQRIHAVFEKVSACSLAGI